MTTIQTEIIVDDNAGLNNKWVKLEEGKRKYLEITNWRTVAVPKIFEGKEKVVYTFKADVLAEGEQATKVEKLSVQQLFETSSYDARRKLNELLKDIPKGSYAHIGIKRTGQGIKTQYDIELYE